MREVSKQGSWGTGNTILVGNNTMFIKLNWSFYLVAGFYSVSVQAKISLLCFLLVLFAFNSSFLA